VPVYVQTAEPTAEQKLIFADMSDDQLLGYGVPAEWLKDVKKATEDTLLVLTDHLPAEAAEALLELATGGRPRKFEAVEEVELSLREERPSVAHAHVPPPFLLPDSFNHPDAQRRFRTIANVEELQRALDYPWEKWTVFLHPDQREWVERDYTGP